MERKRRVLQGQVVSDKMDKSIVVIVNKRKQHSLYKKFITKKYKLQAHDEKNEAKKGDIVKVEETRPISKNKRFRLIEIIKKAEVV